MGLRRKRTFSKKQDVVENKTESTSDSESDETTVQTDVVQTDVVQKTHFTAMLLKANQYEMHGMMFRRGIPQIVPIKFLKYFKSNGWFQVIV